MASVAMMAGVTMKAGVLLVGLVLALAVLTFILIGILASRKPSSGHSGSRAAWIFASIFIFCVLLLAGFFAIFTVRVETERRSQPAATLQHGGVEPSILEAPASTVSLPLEAEEIAREDFEQWQKADALALAAPDKPWLSDAAGSQPWSDEFRGLRIAGRTPGPQGRIVGYSHLEPEDSSKPSAREAARAAARAAAEHSAVRHVGALLLRGIKGAHDVAASVPVEKLKSLADDEARRALPTLIVDRYEQDVPGKSANLKYHRAAVLVKADPKVLDSMVQKLKESAQERAREAVAHRREIVTTVASALGLAFVAFLLYAFLNAGTKGHFAWPLRIISVATLLVVYLGLMYLKGWFPR